MRHLSILYDFDGTQAETFEPCPDGVGVPEAYERAIADIFGPEGLAVYRAHGGLGNRASLEVVRSIKTEVDPWHWAGFIAEQRERLEGLMPEGKGRSLGARGEADHLLAEVLVRQKLSYLLDQVGTPLADGEVWPRPTNGYREHWEEMARLKQAGCESGEFSLTTGILSSGHDEFIRRTFAAWELPAPDVIVTDDDIRGRELPRDPADRVKPAKFPLAIARRELLLARGFEAMELTFGLAAEDKRNLIYVGDDPVKDGEMARAAGVAFALYDPADGSADPEHGIRFEDFGELTFCLEHVLASEREDAEVGELLREETPLAGAARR